MVVKLLLKILRDFSFYKKGVKIQFITHKKDYWWEDEIYDGHILVTPIGDHCYKRQVHYRDVDFKSMEKRHSFYELVSRYNEKNHKKDNFIPLYIGSNYCTFQ